MAWICTFLLELLYVDTIPHYTLHDSQRGGETMLKAPSLLPMDCLDSGITCTLKISSDN